MSQARYKPFGPLLSKSMIVKRSNSQSGAFSAQGMSTGIMTRPVFFFDSSTKVSRVSCQSR